MRISDWSSDVCSSDLHRLAMVVRHARVREGTGHFERRKPDARPPGRKRQRVALTKSRLLDGRQPAKWSEITWIRYRSSSFCCRLSSSAARYPDCSPSPCQHSSCRSCYDRALVSQPTTVSTSTPNSP